MNEVKPFVIENRPSVLYAAGCKLTHSDANDPSEAWTYSFGDMHGSGASPEAATRDFDAYWSRLHNAGQ